MGGSLVTRMAALRTLFAFDAVQVLARLPGHDEYVELWRDGYDGRSATALAQDFPRLYPAGFSQRYGPGDGLPPSISASAATLVPRFEETSVYTGALQAQGFVDGMSLELGPAPGMHGLVHFSSRVPAVFDQHVRTLARGAQMWLEAAVAEVLPAGLPVPAARLLHGQPGLNGGEWQGAGDWPLAARQRLGRALWHLQASQLSCYWLEGRQGYRLLARRLPSQALLVLLTPSALPLGMTAAQLRVLSWLAVGLSDREIAARLYVSERTVQSHVAALLRCLLLTRRAQLAVRAAVQQWFVPDAEGEVLAALTARELP